MKEIRESLIIDPQAVDDIAEKITEYLASDKTGNKRSLRLRLCVEEALNVIYEHYNVEIRADIVFTVKLGMPVVTITFKGKKFNPLETTEIEEASLMILENLGVKYTYSYRSDTNKLTFYSTHLIPLKRKRL